MKFEIDNYCILLCIIIFIVFYTFYYFYLKPINIQDILDNHYYINLDYRTDRKESTIKELSKIGIYYPNRFSAIKKHNGAIGCYMSHLKVVKDARDRGLPCVTIFEDDILFLNPKETLQKLNRIINSNIEWDVIILGGNNSQPYQTINEDCIKVNNCQTTTAYIVKKKYYDTFIDNLTEGLQKLIETNNSSMYALDQYWKKLQKKDNFLLIIPVNVVQKESYSDIEHRNVYYIDMMKNINY